MTRAKQIEAKIIGDSGCYFLSIIEAVTGYSESKGKKVNVDIIKLYELAMDKGWLVAGCKVDRPDLIAGYILGIPMDKLDECVNPIRELKEVKIAKRTLDYIPKENEIEITRYEKEATGVTFSHFVVTRDGEVLYDPYGNSNTVSKGYSVSKRILTVNI